MSRRRALEGHRHGLAEIREIMASMKTLAYMETLKLARFLEAQSAVTRTIEDAAADLLSFFPQTLPEVRDATPVYLLIGSERGFCGDFNHALLRHLQAQLPAGPDAAALLIAVGHKLATLLQDDARVVARVDGASAAEEATHLLDRVVAELETLQTRHAALTILCVHHSVEHGVRVQPLLPPFDGLGQGPPGHSHPPLLNESPRRVLAELTEHYLFAALHQILYTSLMVENQHRVAHLEGALRHLDKQSADLARRSNALRQEEII
jgi:F-type H+-transporting ATPase subunit gamma